MPVRQHVSTALLALMFVALTGCGYNDQGLEEDITAMWSGILNQYQRRADLI